MMMVGLSITGASLFIGTLWELAKKEESMKNTDVILSYLVKQGQEIPETVMTAFLMGLLIRALQTTPKTVETKISIHKEYAATVDFKEAEKIASAYAKEKGLGNVFYVSIDSHSKTIGFTYWRQEITEGL